MTSKEVFIIWAAHFLIGSPGGNYSCQIATSKPSKIPTMGKNRAGGVPRM